MSLSAGDRKHEMANALKIMFDAVGDGFCSRLWFLDSEERFSFVNRTTWTDMAEQGLIKNWPLIGGGLRSQLMPHGWCRALLFSDINETEAFQHRLGTLNSYLKLCVDGRQSDHLVYVETVARETGLPEGWIHSMCACRYWQIVRGVHGAELDPDNKPLSIWIDHRFGLEIIEL